MSNVANTSKSRLYRMVRSSSESIAQAPTCTSFSVPRDLRDQPYQTKKGRDRLWGAGGHAAVPHEATDGEKKIQEFSCPLH